MYENYAIIENDEVVEYPVNPRVFLALQNCYNVPEYWTGGVLDGKQYVYCHCFAPTPPYNKNIIELTPVKNPENGLWYRQYDFVDATPEEIAERTAYRLLCISNDVDTANKYLDSIQIEISQLSEEDQALWAQYKTDLNNLAQQDGYPWDFVWPNKPTNPERLSIGVERI